MATETTPPQTSYDEWLSRRWKLTGRLLVLLWLVAALTVLTAGERRSDLGLLHGGLADGSVTKVEIEGLPEGGVRGGYATVQLAWESRFLNRYTEIVVVSPGEERDGSISSEGLPVVVGDPVAVLRDLRPDVEIVRSEFRSGTFVEAGGWTLRGWPTLLVGPLWLATLLLVVGGPQPWRATRWAWVWIVLAGPFFGAVAYAVLGGPLAMRQPMDRTRRLTGGWAFLLGVFVLGGFGTR